MMRLLIALLFPSLLFAGQGMGPGPGFKAYSAGGAGVVSYVSSGTITRVAATTTITPPIPSGSVGDALVVSCTTDLNQAITQANWTAITSITSSSSRSSMMWRIDDGTASYNFTVSSVDEITCVISRFAKTAGTWAIADSGSAAAGVASSINIPTITATHDDSMALVMVGNDDLQPITTAPSGMTEAALFDTDDPVLGVYYLARDTGDLSGLSATVGGTSDLSTIAIILEAQ